MVMGLHSSAPVPPQPPCGVGGGGWWWWWWKKLYMYVYECICMVWMYISSICKWLWYDMYTIVYLYMYMQMYMYMNMVVVQNSFFSKRPFLAKKKFTLAKLSPYSQKTFAGPYVGLYLGIFVRKQKLDKGHLRVWATIKTHSVAAAHSRVAFCF